VKHYLLVCEGQTDFFVIDEIARKLSDLDNVDIKITPLSPQYDATSQTWPRHGWTAIRNWCKVYGRKSHADVSHLDPHLRQAALRKNWQAMLALSQADGLIIQVDTDIAEHITDGSPFDPSTSHRRDYLEASVLLWLNEPNKPQPIYLALTTHALEAWILATHPESEPVFSDLAKPFNYEDINNLEARLIRLGYQSTKYRGQTKLSKKESLYKHYAMKVAENLPQVRARCPSAEALCSHLEN